MTTSAADHDEQGNDRRNDLGDNQGNDVDDASVTVYPDGPLLVRGPVTIRDADGTVYANPRRTVALCRCGKSGMKPWCDGTHKASRFRD